MTASRAAGDRLGDVAAVAHAAVGDDLDVLAGLEHVLRAGRRDVGDRRRLRDADAQHAARGARRARADADEHAGRAGAHQVQARVVRGTAADDDRHVDLADELLEVQRLGHRGDVLGGDDRALDDEDVEAGVERQLVVLAHALRRQRRADDDALAP